MNTPLNWWHKLDGQVSESPFPELEELIKNHQVHHTQSCDGGNQWDAYVGFNNKLYLVLASDSGNYYGRVDSGVYSPQPADRCFGIDVQDENYLCGLSDYMCYFFLDKKTEEEIFEIWNNTPTEKQ